MRDTRTMRTMRTMRTTPATLPFVIALLFVTVSTVFTSGTASAGAGSTVGRDWVIFGHRALTVPANPTVGPLFNSGLAGDHTCTASVLSVGSGLLLTAAHCLSGNPVGIQFVPGYDGTKPDVTPYGVWTVSRAWVPAGWASGQDEQHDFAILQVRDDDVDGVSTSINDVVGGNGIGIATKGMEVTVPAYVSGAGDAPISCTAALEVDQGFSSFGCAGYLDGTSGAPWIEDADPSTAPAVVGVIGGLHQGGCTDSTSYSPNFESDVFLLMIRAVLGLPSDTAPVPPADGC